MRCEEARCEEEYCANHGTFPFHDPHSALHRNGLLANGLGQQLCLEDKARQGMSLHGGDHTPTWGGTRSGWEYSCTIQLHSNFMTTHLLGHVKLYRCKTRNDRTVLFGLGLCLKSGDAGPTVVPLVEAQSITSQTPGTVKYVVVTGSSYFVPGGEQEPVS